MEPANHYVVKVKLFDYFNKDKVDFIEHRKEFFNDDPILARKEAFRFYQNWLDVLLQAIGKEYVSDQKARQDLQIFLKPNINLSLNLSENDINLSNSVTVGIGVYFIIDIPTPPIFRDEKANDHTGDELIIHGIGNSYEFNNPASFRLSLENELEYYDINNPEYSDIIKEAKCFDVDSQNAEAFQFLETPFDWTGLDDPKHPALNLTITTNFEDIIANGEGESVEFKPTLSYHFTRKSWEAKREVNYKIAQAICAFLNSKGGLLFIGVNDDGTVQGLDFDFMLSDKENVKDYFKLDFDRVLNNFFGFSVKPIVNMELTEVSEKQICVIKVEPSMTKPVFLISPDNKKEFWVRGNASNRQLFDVEEILNYWLNRRQN